MEETQNLFISGELSLNSIRIYLYLSKNLYKLPAKIQVSRNEITTALRMSKNVYYRAISELISHGLVKKNKAYGPGNFIILSKPGQSDTNSQIWEKNSQNWESTTEREQHKFPDLGKKFPDLGKKFPDLGMRNEQSLENHSGLRDCKSINILRFEEEASSLNNTKQKEENDAIFLGEFARKMLDRAGSDRKLRRHLTSRFKSLASQYGKHELDLALTQRPAKMAFKMPDFAEHYLIDQKAEIDTKNLTENQKQKRIDMERGIKMISEKLEMYTGRGILKSVSNHDAYERKLNEDELLFINDQFGSVDGFSSFLEKNKNQFTRQGEESDVVMAPSLENVLLRKLRSNS
jgi:predicted transcriptional regulator